MYRNLYRMSQAGKRKIKPLAHFPFYYSGKQSFPDRFGWPLGALVNNVIFDWSASDGLTPYVGPSLTASGTISTKPSPFNKPNGTNIIAAHMNQEQYINTSNVPSINGDVYVCALVRPGFYDTDGGFRNFFHLGSKDSSLAPCFYLRYYNTNYISSVIRGNTNQFQQIAIASSNAWLFVQYVINRNGLTTLMANNLSDNDSTPSGDIANQQSLVISGSFNPGARTDSAIARIVMCSGVDIADIVEAGSFSFAKNMFHHVLGIHDIINGINPEFTRNSASSAVKNSKLFLYSYNAPMGGKEGVTLNNQSTNECYNNINPQVTTGWITTGGMPINVIADDSTDLESVGSVDCLDVGPGVIELDNTGGGSTQYAYNGAATGNTNKRSLQIRGKHVIGSSGFQLGLYDTVGASFSNGVAINDNYEITKNENKTPVTTDRLCVAVPAGQKINVIAQQCEESNECTDLIPNFATGSTATRLRDYIDTKHSPNLSQGRLTFSIKFNPNIKAATNRVFIDYFLFIYSGGNKFNVTDGTNTIQANVNVLDGLWHNVIVSWGSKGLVIVVDENKYSTSFDGAIPLSSGLRIGGSSLMYPFYEIKDLKSYAKEY